jgi:hypothetical protein
MLAQRGADNDRRVVRQASYREAQEGWRDKPSTTQGLARAGKAGQPMKATDGHRMSVLILEWVGIGTPPGSLKASV